MAPTRDETVRCPRCKAAVDVPILPQDAHCLNCGRKNGLRVIPHLGKRRCQYCSHAPDGPILRPAEPQGSEVPVGADRRLEPRRHLRQEAHIRALAVLTVAGGVFMLPLAGIVAWVGSPIFRGMGHSTAERVSVHAAVVATFVAVAVLSICNGVGLWRYRPWAQKMYVLFSLPGIAASLLVIYVAIETGESDSLIPALLQLACIGAGLWAVWGGSSSDIFSRRYLAVAAQMGGRVRWWGSPFFYVPFVATCSLILSIVVAALLSL